MNVKTRRRYRHLCIVVALICGFIGLAVLGGYLSTIECCPTISLIGRILSSVVLVGVAWVLVSVLYGYVKRTTLIVLSFFMLFVYGLTVYQGMNETVEYHDNQSRTTTIIAPINNTLSIFFPSRGAYSEEDHSEIDASYQVLQLLSYFFFALLAFSFFGKKILNRSGCLLIRYRHKNLFWGYGDNGRTLAIDILNTSVDGQALFVLSNKLRDDQEQDNWIFDQIDNMGAVALYADYDNVSISKRSFSGYRHFFLTEDQDFNVRMALHVLDQLVANTPKEKTHLYIRTEQEYIDQFFEAKFKAEELRKHIEIHIYNHSALTARQFVSDFPALEHKSLTVDTVDCQVQGRFHVLLLGFGWTGFELLKKMVCDVQFKQIEFSFTVIDRDYEGKHGRYKYLLEDAFKSYNIEINPLFQGGKPAQVNGEQFYDWLNEDARIKNFDRIIVALGDDELNVNTALQIHRFRVNYQEVNGEFEPIFAHVRNFDQYKYYQNPESSITLFGGQVEINSSRVVINQEMDRVAKMVHYVYSKYDVPLFVESEFDAIANNWTLIEEQWAKASLFNQDSCRAVAMNIDNMIRLCGGEQEFRRRIQEPRYLELLAELEHLRWSAFHFMNGIREWKMCEVTNSNGKLRFGTILAKHICLVPYSELEAASATVNAARKPNDTQEDYKESDRRIVRHFALFLKFKKSLR